MYYDELTALVKDQMITTVNYWERSARTDLQLEKVIDDDDVLVVDGEDDNVIVKQRDDSYNVILSKQTFKAHYRT